MPELLTCADCIDGLTLLQTDNLAAPDAVVVADHLTGCRDCSIFADQLLDTDSLLQYRARAIPRADMTALPPSNEIKATVSALQEIAHTLDANQADDLVQDVLSAALTSGSAFDLPQLTRALSDRVAAGAGLGEHRATNFGDTVVFDVDADSAELFYPAFYTEGPDLGRFIDAPNQWGNDDRRLTPESDLITAELLEHVDDALERLPLPSAQVGRLVLLDGLSVSDAAGALLLSPHEAVAALHQARVHLRGVVAASMI